MQKVVKRNKIMTELFSIILKALIILLVEQYFSEVKWRQKKNRKKSSFWKKINRFIYVGHKFRERKETGDINGIQWYKQAFKTEQKVSSGV